MLRLFERRLHNLSVTPKLSLILSALIAIVWMCLTTFILDFKTSSFLSELQIDKLVHFSGGVAAAGILSLFLKFKFPKKLIIPVLFIGLIWEVWELTCLPSQFGIFTNNFYIWLFDTLGDLASDILGAFFWVKISKK